MIVFFKKYPELGRLKVVHDNGEECDLCVFDNLGRDACDETQSHKTKTDADGDPVWCCMNQKHHYEPEHPGKERDRDH